MKKIITISILLAIFTLHATAQNEPIKFYITPVNIFEGEIIKVEGFSPYPNRIYTSNLVKINRVFKGDLKPGEIVDLVTRGGNLFNEKGEHIANETVSDGKEPSFAEGFKGVFLCYSYTEKLPVNPNTAQYKRLRLTIEKLNICSYARKFNTDGNYAVSTAFGNFETREKLYELLMRVEGVTIPSKGFDPTFDSDIFENMKQIKLYYNESLDHKPHIKKPFMYISPEDSAMLVKKKSSGSSESTKSISAISSNLSFSFVNPRLSAKSATERYFEFDVAINASAAGTYLYYAGGFSIQYNTDAFDEFILMNESCEVSLCGAYAGSYRISSYGDATNNKIFADFYIISGQPRVQVPVQPSLFLHVKIKIKTCGVKTKLKFVTYGAGFSSFYDAAVGGGIYDYSSLVFSNELNINTCEILINDFLPKQVTSGTFESSDTLIIKGSGFGASRKAPYVGIVKPNGDVLFRNADSVNSYLPHLNDYDYISWSDNQIRLRVPSLASWKVNQSKFDGPAGSGFIKVRNYMGDIVTSTSRVDIVFSTTSKAYFYNDDSLEKHRVHIANLRGAPTGDMKFVAGKNLLRNKKAFECVENALAAWSCELNINLYIQRDSLGNPITSDMSNPGDYDYRNVIYINDDLSQEPTPLGKALMQCSPYSFFCSNGNNRVAYLKQAVIAIGNLDTAANNTGAKWFYDATGTDSVPTGRFDFYSALLHEIGHALLLEHIIDTINLELMHRSQPSGPLTANKRLLLKTSRPYAGTYPCIAAVRNTITASKNVVYNNCDSVSTLVESPYHLCGSQLVALPQSPTLYIDSAFNLPYYVTGTFNAGNAFTVQLSDNTGSFATPVVIGTKAATGSGTISCTIPLGTPAGSGYKIRIVSSNPSIQGVPADLKLKVIAYGASLVTGSVTPGLICAGTAKSITVPYSFVDVAFASGNVFTAQLSNAAGSFASPVNIGTVTSTAAGNISATIPASSAAGAGYRVRVVSSDPQLEGSDNGSDIIITSSPSKPTITASGSTTFCAGGSVTLTSGQGNTYQWSPGGQTSQGITVNTAGAYSVKVTNAEGCISASSDAVNVVVNPYQVLNVNIEPIAITTSASLEPIIWTNIVNCRVQNTHELYKSSGTLPAGAASQQKFDVGGYIQFWGWGYGMRVLIGFSPEPSNANTNLVKNYINFDFLNKTITIGDKTFQYLSGLYKMEVKTKDTIAFYYLRDSNDEGTLLNKLKINDSGPPYVLDIAFYSYQEATLLFVDRLFSKQQDITFKANTDFSSPPCYLWQVNGLPIQTNCSTNNTSTINYLKPGDVVNCIASTTSQCVTGPNQIISNPITVDPPDDLVINSSITHTASKIIQYCNTITINAGINTTDGVAVSYVAGNEINIEPVDDPGFDIDTDVSFDNDLCFLNNFNNTLNYLGNFTDELNRTLPTKENNIAGSNITVFPNPNDGSFIIENKTGNIVILSAEVYNEQGKLIKTIKPVENTQVVNMPNASSGIYLLRLVTKNQIINKKLMINMR
jgi:hypothetical protein